MLVTLRSLFGPKKHATDSGFIFLDSRFGNGFLSAVGSEGGFGLGREKQVYEIPFEWALQRATLAERIYVG